MIRSGRHRAWPVPRGRRPGEAAAVFMLLALLGASLLVSAGSAHHRAGATPTAPMATHADVSAVHSPPAVGADLLVVRSPAVHEHRYGNDWVPSPGKRLRPAANVTAVRTLPAAPARVVGPLRATSRFPAPAASIDGLIAIGVLRV